MPSHGDEENRNRRLYRINFNILLLLKRLWILGTLQRMNGNSFESTELSFPWQPQHWNGLKHRSSYADKKKISVPFFPNSFNHRKRNEWQCQLVNAYFINGKKKRYSVKEIRKIFFWLYFVENKQPISVATGFILEKELFDCICLNLFLK